jgi:cytochrome c-type biogenesis protein
MTFDPASLQNVSLLAFLLAFVGGVVTSIGPCNIATIPLIVGYVGGGHNLPRARSFVLSLAFAIGLALAFMLLGVAAAKIGGLIGAATRWWYYLVAGVCFVTGLNMLGVVKLNLPMWFGDLRERIGLKGIPGALALGLVSGLVASQCATPVLAAILTYVMAKGALTFGAALLFVYALGARRAGGAGRNLYRGVKTNTILGTLDRDDRKGRWRDYPAAGVLFRMDRLIQ